MISPSTPQATIPDRSLSPNAEGAEGHPGTGGVDRETVARAICIAMGDDPEREGPFGKWFKKSPYGAAADAILSLTPQAPAGGEAKLREALERLAKLTPHSANAQTAQDFCLTVRAIAESALSDHKDTSDGGEEKPTTETRAGS